MFIYKIVVLPADSDWFQLFRFSVPGDRRRLLGRWIHSIWLDAQYAHGFPPSHFVFRRRHASHAEPELNRRTLAFAETVVMVDIIVPVLFDLKIVWQLPRSVTKAIRHGLCCWHCEQFGWPVHRRVLKAQWEESIAWRCDIEEGVNRTDCLLLYCLSDFNELLRRFYIASRWH